MLINNKNSNNSNNNDDNNNDNNNDNDNNRWSIDGYIIHNWWMVNRWWNESSWKIWKSVGNIILNQYGKR